MSMGFRSKLGAICLSLCGLVGCAHQWGSGASCGACQPACAATCEPACATSCEPCGGKIRLCNGGRCRDCLSKLEWGLFGWMCKKSNAVPETLPLGSTVRSHIQVMETNGEAADFIIHRHDFVGESAALTPDGRDKVLEIAARMPSAPFPVLIERSMNNSDPELDALRRNLVAQVLTDLGNTDAQQRTVVSTSYGPGYTATRSEQMYYQHIYRGGNNNNNFGGGGGFGGGFGGGGGVGGGGGGF